MIIIKLGGSVITCKSMDFFYNEETVKRLCREIALSGVQAIVVHGAGSFGHPLAEKYSLAKGFVDDLQIHGFSLTQSSVRLLNLRVLQAMQEAGLSPVSIPPGSVARCDNGEIRDFNSSVFRSYLEKGLLPVTFGDAVLDVSRGFAICSGDLLIQKLSEMLSPEKVVFAVDVDGIYERRPLTGSEKLLAETDVCGLKKVAAGKGDGTDVTGGMRGKISAIEGICEKGIDVLVVNGLVPGRLYDALCGTGAEGTTVKGCKIQGNITKGCRNAEGFPS
ncbi:MAG: kinase [Thermoplasmata archaeon HGW-Thermoplasmata-1]|nr:MAG: kinase [Thermoplasmata archaeon HGW-Thermoplasmata-1]